MKNRNWLVLIGIILLCSCVGLPELKGKVSSNVFVKTLFTKADGDISKHAYLAQKIVETRRKVFFYFRTDSKGIPHDVEIETRRKDLYVELLDIYHANLKYFNDLKASEFNKLKDDKPFQIKFTRTLALASIPAKIELGSRSSDFRFEPILFVMSKPEKADQEKMKSLNKESTKNIERWEKYVLENF